MFDFDVTTTMSEFDDDGDKMLILDGKQRRSYFVGHEKSQHSCLAKQGGLFTRIVKKTFFK